VGTLPRPITLLTAERIEKSWYRYDELASARSVYNYYRDYDPTTGRYLQPDPIGLAGGLNLYGYVGANPLRYSDQFGLIVPGDPDPSDEILIAMGLKRLYDLYKGAKGAKSAAELAKHLQKLNKAKDELRDLSANCPKGKTAQEAWKEAIEKLERQIAGHEKEIRQKWPEALQ
jgi:RHS repeat-associated protein